jgi:hypothetical protein
MQRLLKSDPWPFVEIGTAYHQYTQWRIVLCFVSP